MTADELRRRVDRLALTQRAMAGLLGLSLNGLTKQLSGERKVSRQTELLLECVEHHQARGGVVKVRPQRQDGARCVDCRLDVSRAGHWYMVHNQVWALTGIGSANGDGVLCLNCLEKRLGRPLVEEDFKPTTGTEWGGERMLPRAWTQHVLTRATTRLSAALEDKMERDGLTREDVRRQLMESAQEAAAKARRRRGACCASPSSCRPS